MPPQSPIPRPRHRLHAAIGMVPVGEGERLLPLVERRLPADWLALDDDEQLERLIRLVANFLEERPELVAEVDVTDRDDLNRLERCPGARAGGRPYQVVLPLDQHNLQVLLSTNPSCLWVTKSDGTPVMLLEGNWDGVFVYE